MSKTSYFPNIEQYEQLVYEFIQEQITLTENPLRFSTGTKPTHDVYSDRLFQWNYEKYNTLCQKHFSDRSQYWSDRAPENIEAFLREYFDKPLLALQTIHEYTNNATSYPVWQFGYTLS